MAARFLFLLLALAGAGLACAGEPRVIPALYPEGPLWQDERLYFAEMHADRVMVVDAAGARPFFVQEGCGPTAIATYGQGFLVLCHLGARVVAVDARGQEIRHWERDESGRPLMDPNDASADGEGGAYFSDPGRFSASTRPHGWVMHLSKAGALRRVAGPLWYPNGVHVAGAALYVSEHLGRKVLRYEIAAPGRLGAVRTFAHLSGLPRPDRYRLGYALAGPDGLEFGPDGNLYVAMYGEGRLLRLSPRGELLGITDLPMRYLTNVAFGRSGVAVTGAFDNRTPRSPGEVRILATIP